MGIDPGTRIVGYGIIESKGSRLLPVTFGVIRATQNRGYVEQLRSIFKGLEKVVQTQEPDVIAIEDAFYGLSASSAFRMGEGRGVAIVAASLEGQDVFQYTPTEVKKAVVGNGRGHKTQVQEMVRLLLGLPERPEPEDAADALAVAICHCNKSQR